MCVAFRRSRQAEPEEQITARLRTEPELPVSRLQQSPQPPFPAARHSFFYEASLPPRAFWTLPLFGPLSRVYSYGATAIAFCFWTPPGLELWVSCPCGGPWEAPQNHRKLQDFTSLWPSSVLPQLSLVCSPAQCVQLQTAPHSPVPPAPWGGSTQSSGRGQLFRRQLPH